MNQRIFPGVRGLRRYWIASLLALLALSAVVFRMVYDNRPAPAALPSWTGQRVEAQEARLTALAYADPGAAGKAFGFDIRRAGLLPVRLAIDNRSDGVIRLNPRQVFLIDRQGLAWPLLTADQARDRMAGARVLNEPAKTVIPAVENGAAETVTGFAMDLRPWDAAAPVLEEYVRRNLSLKSLRNPRLQPGERAEGYLFFPGREREEIQGADLLHLGLEFDGAPQVARIPLAPTPSPEPKP